MQDEITELYYSSEPLCTEGRMFLADRGLSIPSAIKAGVCSRNGLIYFIYTRNGEIVRWKSRDMKDKKLQKMNILKHEDQSGFRMPFFSHFKAPSCDYLVITEGEFDSIALSQLGASNCVSLPNGAGSVETTFRNNYEFLQQFKLIYIAFDMDKAGEEAAKKAMSMISPSKYRRICFPCKDANDWLKENPYLEFKDLEVLMENARKIENPAITNVSDLPHSFYDAIDLGISSGWKRLDAFLGGIRLGEVTVISADTGSDKSTYCIKFYKNLEDQGKGIWLNSYEMDPIMVNRKLAGMVLGKQMKFDSFTEREIEKYKTWLKDKNVHLNISNSKIDIELLRNQFELASMAYGIKYILLDHLDYIHANGKKKTALENIDDAVREIHALAMEFRVGVILVVHPKQMKPGDEITMHDLKGSSSIKQYADNIIIMTRMDRMDVNDKLRVKIAVFKNRLCGIESSFYLRYVPDIDGYTEGF